jgi:signal transduction histidine kinase
MARDLHDTVATDLAGAISLFKVYVEGHPGSVKKGAAAGTLIDVLEILE